MQVEKVVQCENVLHIIIITIKQNVHFHLIILLSFACCSQLRALELPPSLSCLKVAHN